MNKLKLEELNKTYDGGSPEDIIQFLLREIGTEKAILASSLSIEDQVLTQMLLKIDPKARVFFLDTGRHFQDTYNLMDATMQKLKFKYEIYAPEHKAIEDMVSMHGPNLFYESIQLRKMCCGVRKISTLKRALSSVDAWICGLRRTQSTNRGEIDIFEWDDNYGIYKVNPLAGWSEEMVWQHIWKEGIPYNALYDKGFRSIGCQPCTRAVKPSEDIRSGRWWWETSGIRECGLHVIDTDVANKMDK